MDKMLVIVFEEESRAYEALRALRALDGEGSITLYATAVIARKEKEGFTVRQAADEGPLGTAVGLLTGSLLGLWAGPAGLAVAAGTGMMGGALYDLARTGVNVDFLNEAGSQLEPGMVAVVAEVAEDWVTPVDTRIEPLGGFIFRRTRDDVVDAQIESEVKATQEEVAALKAEISRSSAARKAKVEEKLRKAKAKLQDTQARAKASLDAVTREGEAKVKLLQQRMDKATGETKAALEARISAVRTQTQQRRDRLQRAWAAAKRELESTSETPQMPPPSAHEQPAQPGRQR